MLSLIVKASIEDMRSRGLIERDSVFARHLLGGYSALATLAVIMPAEPLVSVVFYRDLTMQVDVEGDTEGRSNYSMIAVNPTRTFNEQALQCVVDNIVEGTKWLLVVVNRKVIKQRYVCSGDVRFSPYTHSFTLIDMLLAPRRRLPRKCAQFSQGA